MFKHISISFVLISLSALSLADFMLLDEGVRVVSGPVGNVMITHSDVHHKVNVDGRLIPLDKQIERIIIDQEVKADKMSIDETAADKYLANIQKTYNMTQQDLEDLAGQCYRTYPELKELLRLNYTEDFFLHNKFRAHLVPTDQDVAQYHEKNPEIEPGYFILRFVNIHFAGDKESASKEVQAIISGQTPAEEVDWGNPIAIQADELADDLDFVKNLATNEIFVVEDSRSFKLYQLVEKQDAIVVSLDKRKAVIIDTLNRTMYEDLLKNYQKHMFDNVAIINLVG